MSEPIGVHPFEHNGNQYEAKVFGDTQGYQIRVYKDDILTDYPPRLVTYEEVSTIPLYSHGSDTKTLIEHYIDEFKERNP